MSMYSEEAPRTLLPRAAVHIMEQVGHLPHAEAPDTFVELLCK